MKRKPNKRLYRYGTRLDLVKNIEILPDEKFYYVCLTCHKTVDKINKDGDCLNCSEEINNSEEKYKLPCGHNNAGKLNLWPFKTWVCFECCLKTDAIIKI